MPKAAFMPTEAQLKEILARGPYTKPLEDVYPLLSPIAVRPAPAPRPPPSARLRPPAPAQVCVLPGQVKKTLRYWMHFFFKRVARKVRDDFGVQDVADASLAQIAHGLLGRPEVNPGALPRPPPTAPSPPAHRAPPTAHHGAPCTAHRGIAHPRAGCATHLAPYAALLHRHQVDLRASRCSRRSRTRTPRVTLT